METRQEPEPVLAEDARGAEPKVSPVACWGQAELEASFRPEPSGSAEIELADPGTVSEVCFYRPSAPRVFVAIAAGAGRLPT